MDGIAGVQARINEILGRFGTPPPAAFTPTSGSGTDFATALTDAQAAAATGATGAPAATTPTDGATATTSPSGVDPNQWAGDLLERLALPQTAENARAMVAWQQAEGTKAKFNPLATTQGFPNSTRFNSVGVKNYASYTDGLDATVKVMHNGLYDEVLAALRKGDSAEAVGEAVAASRWGTGEGLLRVLRDR